MKKKSEEKKSEIRFGNILSKSFNEYKLNFKSIFKFLFLLVGIPYILLMLVEVIFISVDPTILSIMSSPELLNQVDEGTLGYPLYYTVINLVFTILNLFLGVLVSVGLLSTSLSKSKFSFKELMENGKSRYWKFFGFSVVIFVFVLLLTLLLIIPGIIFGVYWIFAACIFLDKKETIKKSLKKSKEMVKGRWWKTFGFYLLFGLILIGFSIVISIVNAPSAAIMMFHILNGTEFGIGLLITNSVLSMVYNFLVSLIGVPLSVLFVKNFYFEMKK
jgi:hypothetical protein